MRARARTRVQRQATTIESTFCDFGPHGRIAAWARTRVREPDETHNSLFVFFWIGCTPVASLVPQTKTAESPFEMAESGLKG